ncbi:hypothetical protein HDV05_001982 [Chytridiales sp. JEL 0842]|nr:hypothetical protein HDV05_001982 [Chytridiales sp. JEL 0842]
MKDVKSTPPAIKTGYSNPNVTQATLHNDHAGSHSHTEHDDAHVVPIDIVEHNPSEDHKATHCEFSPTSPQTPLTPPGTVPAIPPSVDYINKSNYAAYTSHATITSSLETMNETNEKERNKVSLSVHLRRCFYLLITKGADNGDERDPQKSVTPSEIRQKNYNDDTHTLWGAVSRGDLVNLKRIEERDGEMFERKNFKHILDQTGAEGETLLHIAVLHGHEHIIDYLIHRRPNLVNDVYEGFNYFGESCLHILAVQGKIDMMKKFMAHGGDVHCPRATGRFFKQSGTLYYGETVLSFAACSGQLHVVKYLIEQAGFDPDATDHYGNTVLHVLAYWGYYNDTLARDPNNPAYQSDPKHQEAGGIFLYLLSVCDGTIANRSGMTPLQVAVWRGKVDMVTALLNYQRTTLWVFGKTSAHLYDLTELDTYVDLYTMNHSKGALDIAVRGKNIAIVSMPIFQRLLEAKWVAYAKNMFYFKLFGSLMYMFLFTAAIILMPNGREFYTVEDDTEVPWRSSYLREGARGYARIVIDAILCMSNAYALSEEFEEIVDLGWGYFTGYGAGENIIQWINIIGFFFVVVFRAALLVELENAALGIHALSGWIYVMYYSKGFKELGTLYLIFVRIIFGDLLRFLLLVSVFILGFGEALWIQMSPFASHYSYWYEYYRNNDPDNPKAAAYGPNDGYFDWKGFPTGILWTLRFIMGDGDYDTYRNAKIAWLALTIYIIATITIVILLMNVFIAMLNQTYSSVMADTEKQWRLLWAELILKMDDQILSKHYPRIYKGLDTRMPPCRIGFPTRLKENFFSQESKTIYRAKKKKEMSGNMEFWKMGTNKLKEKMRKWFTVASGGRAGGGDVVLRKEFYNYSCIFEFFDSDLPTRMIASGDANSLLSKSNHAQAAYFEGASWGDLLEQNASRGRSWARSMNAQQRAAMSKLVN